jgi:hypothetical protein
LTNGLGRREMKFHKIKLSNSKRRIKIDFCSSAPIGVTRSVAH